MYTDFFPPGSVVWDLAGGDKFQAIRETIFRSSTFRAIEGLDLEEFTRTVIRREKEQSTGFGHGIAIAHGRTVQVPTSEIALGVSRQGIPYQSIDDMPVHLLFIVASHPDRQIDYLRILSSLATLARNELFRQEMLSCLCREEVEEKVCNAFNGVLRRSYAG